MAGARHALLIGIESYPQLEGATLQGPYNDVLEIGTLLMERFEFPPDNISILLDEAATQEAVRQAFDATCHKVEKGDVVVCFYAGHGSRIRDPARPEGWRESIVPVDTGRGGEPNRDLTDLEIDRWIRRLNQATPYVTLVFDCCHSGSITRDAFGAATREAPPDTRSAEAMFEDGLVPEILRDPAARDDASTGYVGAGRQAVMVAACRAQELANEYRLTQGGKTYTHGIFSYALARALKSVPSGTTWRDVFEKIGPEVTAVYRQQHPQVEGDWDRLLFDVRKIRPRSYLKLVELGDRRVKLAGGAAHGVSHGSLWSIHPHGARHAGVEALGRVRVERVAPAASEAVVVETAEGAVLEAGQRAFLSEQNLAAPGLRVRLDVDDRQAAGRDLVRGRLAASSFLSETADDDDADVLVRCLAPRSEVAAGDPCPRLGPLAGWTWTAVGADGLLAVHLRAPGEEAALVADLDNAARFRGLLAIENPDPASALEGRVRLEILRRDGAAFIDAEPSPGDGLVTLEEGEMIDLVIRNVHDADLWISLVQFNCDGKIDLLVPLHGHPTYRPDGYRMRPGEVLKLSDYYSQHVDFGVMEGFAPTLPKEGFPWAAESGEVSDTGHLALKLMVTTGPADFEFLSQGATRDPGPGSHPLHAMARLYATGQGEAVLRSVGGDPEVADWTTVRRTLAIRRPVK